MMQYHSPHYFLMMTLTLCPDLLTLITR